MVGGMMKVFEKHLYLFIVILTLITSSCAFSPVKRPIIEQSDLTKSRIYKINASDLYEIIDDTVIDLGYTIKQNIEDSRSIFTNVKQVEIASNCNCGTWNGSFIGGYAGSELLIHINSIDDNTSELVLTSSLATRFRGRNLYGVVTRDETYRCKSYGTIENQFFASLDMKVSSINQKKMEHKASVSSSDDNNNLRSSEDTESTSASSNSESNISATAEKIKKLEAMKALGLLSQEEFDREREKLTTE
jgi:hypothetical protein